MNKQQLDSYQADFNSRHPGHAEAVAARKKEEKASKSSDKKEQLARKMKGGMSTADHINAERKRQGYKPMSAKDKRIHEGMDKYL